MNKLFIILMIMCAFANGVLANELPIGMTPANLPTHSPSSKLSVWVGGSQGMEGASQSAYLYSDGTYCQILGAMGAIVTLNGRWQFNDDKTKIDVWLKPNQVDKFFIKTNEAVIDDEQDKYIAGVNTLTLPDLYFYKQPIYLAFSNQRVPSEMVLFDYDKHDNVIIIPNHQRYLFVSSAIQDGKEHQIARFDLGQIKQNPYNITLSSNTKLMGVSQDEISNIYPNNTLTYVIKNSKVGLKNHYSDEIEFFNETVNIDLNAHQNDDINFRQLHQYCLGNYQGAMLDLMSNKHVDYTKPTYLDWHGKISMTADWLKTQD